MERSNFHFGTEALSIFFSPSLFLTSKDGNFYKTLEDWDKRTSLSNLLDEQQRLTAWVESEITSKPKHKITTPPIWNSMGA